MIDNPPRPNVPPTLYFFAVLICNFITAEIGNTKIAISSAISVYLIPMKMFKYGIHFPGSSGFHDFATGVDWKVDRCQANYYPPDNAQTCEHNEPGSIFSAKNPMIE